LAKASRARAGDGAEVLRQIGLAHADAGIGDGERARFLVRHDAQLGLFRQAERVVGQRLEAAAVHGVGGVGDQLAQEDLALGVERVDHQIQQAADLGAEFMPLHGFAHHSLPRGSTSTARDMRGRRECFNRRLIASRP
jgi:hypothetical protein